MKLIRALPASTLEAISHALNDGRLKPPYTPFAVAEWVPQNCREPFAAELLSLQARGFTPATLAISVAALAEDAAARQKAMDAVQLVWTSPDDHGPHVRDTSVVIGQLLTEARYSLWLATYKIYDGRELFSPLADSWNLHPELQVSLVVNVPADEDKGWYGEEALKRYAETFWKYHWPWSRRPSVYYDPRAAEKNPVVPACQHSKCIVVDGLTAFITSANFTEAAHERNVELGVLFRASSTVAQSIQQKFETLIKHGFLKLMPGSQICLNHGQSASTGS